MKRYLLLFTIMASGVLYAKVNAQCTVTNPSVKLNSSLPDGNGNCLINFDLSFDMQQNNGNKYIWLHLWLTSSYPNLTYSSPPTATELANTIANIGINNDAIPPIFLTNYKGTAVPVDSDGTLTKIDNGDGTNKFTITGIQISIAGGCDNAISITGDVWSSQAQSQNAVHCFSKGIQFIPNDPVVRGTLFCTLPRQYKVDITTSSLITISGTYDVFIDNGDGIFNKVTDSEVVTDVAFSASSSSPYSSNQQNYPGNNTKPTSDRSLWVEVTTIGLTNKTYAFLENSCIPLPVKFSSFTAARNKSNVAIKWETSMEINNRGFYVQRNINGSWENIAFVFSQADNGNSNSVLSYSYNDLNTTKGVTQYRIQQVDLDGKARYSEIRSVRGEANISKLLVYPNPTSSGNVNVVFEDQSPKNVTVLDMSGRMIKQYRNVINNVSVDNLENGIYSIQVTDVSTATISVEKVVVKKR